MVSGPGLAHPILLDDWDENLRLLVAVVQAPRAPRAAVRSLPRRPRLRLSLFWGWGGKERPKRPGEANQSGWLYPAHGSRRAVIDLLVNGGRFPRLAPPAALRIFARHGVPLRL